MSLCSPHRSPEQPLCHSRLLTSARRPLGRRIRWRLGRFLRNPSRTFHTPEPSLPHSDSCSNSPSNEFIVRSTCLQVETRQLESIVNDFSYKRNRLQRTVADDGQLDPGCQLPWVSKLKLQRTTDNGKVDVNPQFLATRHRRRFFFFLAAHCARLAPLEMTDRACCCGKSSRRRRRSQLPVSRLHRFATFLLPCDSSATRPLGPLGRRPLRDRLDSTSTAPCSRRFRRRMTVAACARLDREPSGAIIFFDHTFSRDTKWIAGATAGLPSSASLRSASRCARLKSLPTLAPLCRTTALAFRS